MKIRTAAALLVAVTLAACAGEEEFDVDDALESVGEQSSDDGANAPDAQTEAGDGGGAPGPDTLARSDFEFADPEGTYSTEPEVAEEVAEFLTTEQATTSNEALANMLADGSASVAMAETWERDGENGMMLLDVVSEGGTTIEEFFVGVTRNPDGGWIIAFSDTQTIGQ